MKLPDIQSKSKLANYRECTGCLACENICKENAISHYEAEDGHIYIKIDNNKCIGCLMCERTCVASRGGYGENDISKSSIYAAWSNNQERRATATSGGVFAAFAETVILSGGCVIGASLNGFECKHILVDKLEDIIKLQGSKYMSSSMEDVYKIISRELNNRDVLFAGLGCQCAGVIAFFNNYKTSYKLYTVDLVCGGIPSRILIDKYAQENPDIEGILSFRSKEKYELSVRTHNSVHVVEKKSLPLHGFNCGLTNRYCCYECQFAKAHRKTDITIGDLWNSTIFPDEHKKGISMVIAHSQEGEYLLKNSDITYDTINWREALLYNKRTVCGHQIVYYPRKILARAAKKSSSSRFYKLYCITMTPRDIDLFVFRVYRYLKERILAKKNARLIMKMTKYDNWGKK